MIGALIGAGLSAAGSIWGGIQSAKAARQARQRVERAKKENDSWFNREYYEDPTKRASALAVLNRTEENILRRNRAAAGRQAVMGGTEDSVTAAREANSETLAEATSNIVAQNDARRDSIGREYRSRRQELNDQLNGIDQQQAGSIGQAVQGLASTAGTIASAFDGGGSKKNSGNSVKK